MVHDLSWLRVFALAFIVLCTPMLCCAEDPANGGSPTAAVTAQIDAIFDQEWQAAKIAPQVADDAMFLRRATLDLTGLIPTVGEVRGFLNDSRPDKRAKLIADLLRRPRHARLMAGVWRDVLLPHNTPETAAAAFEIWLQGKFRDNVAYDALVREILTAQGTSNQSVPVVFFASNHTKPEELAASASQAFLGLQVRCAQCHDHPFTQWKQADFWGFAAFFARTQGPSNVGELVPVADRADGEVRHPKTLKVLLPKPMDGPEMAATTSEPRRAVLARWVTSGENPYFARAAVNRAWWVLFGRGLVQPVDDLGPHNPSTHEAVLTLLATDFVQHDFNLRRTLEIIAGTRAYQTSSTPHQPGTAADPDENYATMAVRSLSPQQVYDALLQAAGERESLERPGPEAVAERRAFLAQLDAPTRQPTEYQGGIPQALMLLNGPLVARLTNPTTGDFLAALIDSPFLKDEQRVETLFLATLSRFPRVEERERMQKLLSSKTTSAARAQTLGDIHWALLNSTEFVLNR